MIGCGPPVFVIVDEPGERPLEVCVGAVCSPPGSAFPAIREVQLGEEAEVVVRVAGGGAEAARTMTTPVQSKPNGEGCDPVCRSVRLRLTVDDQLVPG